MAMRRNYQRGLEILIRTLAVHDNPALLKRFEVDTRLTLRLMHPCLNPFFDAWHDDVSVSYAMRPMPHVLKHKLSTGGLALDATTRILQDVTAALDYLHSRSMLHRALTPDSVLLDEAGHACLWDYGIARPGYIPVAGDDEPVPIEYLSPDVLRNEYPFGIGVDVYGVGLLLYEMLTGRNPFAAESRFQTLIHVTTLPVPDVTLLRPDVPPAVNAVIQKATAKTPGERYATVQALCDAFMDAAGR